MADELDTTTSSTPESAPSPSPSSAPATDSAPSSPPSEPTSESSGDSKESLLNAVLKVVPESTEPDVLADPAHPEAPDKPDDGQAEAESESDDDDSEPPAEAASPLIRKKINKLLKQRRELRSENAQLKPVAEIGSQLETFAKTNDLSGDDIATALKIAAARRAGHQAFYEAIAPYVRESQEYLGIALPQEVRQMVQSGQMTEQMAKEYVRQQMDHRRVLAERSHEQTSFAKQAYRAAQDQVNRSVIAFEQQLAASDPDYKAKQASVLRTAQAMLFERGGTITNVNDAIAITKAAYDEVNATIRKQRPAPQATSRMPNGNGQTHSARAEPGSLMEAALVGLSRSRNGAGHP